MFERYTEKARRTIFFARYEASQFGSPCIEAEYLLLGLLREDKVLADRFLRSPDSAESIRKQIEAQTEVREKTSTALDLPLSHQCERALAYGAEEAERLGQKHIGTGHLLLGLLREEKSLAAQLLRERGVMLDSVRAEVKQSDGVQHSRPASFARLEEWHAEVSAQTSIRTVKRSGIANSIHYALYRDDPPIDDEGAKDATPAARLAQIQKRLRLTIEAMEQAIANHEFQNARHYSDEAQKERDNLRALRGQFNLVETPAEAPLLCIEIIGDARFSEIQKRCDAHIEDGVAEVWLLDTDSKRAYTVTRGQGLREFRGEILHMEQPPLKMDLSRIFA